MKPKTKEKQHLAKIKRIEAKMTALETKHPEIVSSTLRNDCETYGSLMRALIYARIDRDYCKSDDPDRMCEECNCWKQARAASM